MGLRIMINPNGSYRPTWYATYRDGARTRSMNLGIEIKGTPPASLSVRDTGDAVFEKSRGLAEAKLADFLKEARDKRGAERLVQNLVAAKTGEAVQFIRIADLGKLEVARLKALWLDASTRQHQATLAYRRIIFNRFASFAQRENLQFVHEVKTPNVNAYFHDLAYEYSRETVGKHVHVLSSAFRRHAPIGSKSPFGDVPDLLRQLSKQSPTIHRAPLSAAQVVALWNTAKDLDRKNPGDIQLHPLAVTASCTGLRLGDVCNLKWTSIHLDAKPNPLIVVVTAKTGARISLPIFEELRPVLEAALAEREDGEEYVFPAAHARYTADRQSIVRMGKRLFALALFDKDEAEVATPEDERKSPLEVVHIIREKINAGKRRDKIEDVYLRHVVKGQTYRDIERDTGFSRGQISSYLATVEDLIGQCFRHGNAYGKNGAGIAARIRKTRHERNGSGKAASIYGWHSLRGSFILLALARGIPQDLIRKAVGHSSNEMTLANYVNPTEKNAADLFARYSGGTLLSDTAQNAITARETAAPALPPPKSANAAQADFDALKLMLGALTAAQRKELKKLLSK